MKFSDYPISKELKANLAKLGWKKPTDIQFKSIKAILDGEDVMAIAQTGTGKTAAFAIPLINMVQTKRGKYSSGFEGVQVLVMVPTRELAAQIGKVFNELGEGTHVRSLALFGGDDQDPQKAALAKGVDILIATPGRMFDLMSQGDLSIKGVKHLVLDEADLMLDLGFADDIKGVLGHLPKKRQTLFFSATISKHIKKLAYDVVRNAIRIQISPKNPVSKNVDHAVLFLEMDDKRFFLENILKEYPEKKVIAFVRTKVRAGRVMEAMKRVQLESMVLHGDLTQDERFDIIKNFSEMESGLLITTDVACRGIDIPGIDYVVNYDLPENPENYVHRCGRTGRGRSRGQAMSFCSPEENLLLETIEEYIGEEITRYDLSTSDYKSILEDTEEKVDDWKSLLKKANEDFGDEWE